MAITILAILLAIAVLLLARRREPPLERREPLRVAIWLICGTCSGDGDVPWRTEMARDGSCASCGGHSFVLASEYFYSMKRRRPAPDAIAPPFARNDVRVIRFENRRRLAR
jgi:hypothetical protein